MLTYPTTLSNGLRGLRGAMLIEIRDPVGALPSPGAVHENSCPPPDPGCSPGPCLDFIASDESLDRYHEVICAAGWRLDTYRRNPVFQNAHQYGDILFTLGRALITEVRGHSCLSDPPRPSDGRGIKSEGGGPHLFQRIQFATEVNPIARIAYGLYKGKFLNAVSVGFIPLRWLDADGAEHTARARINDCPRPSNGRGEAGEGKVARGHFRRQYLEQELLEVSAVGIPANPNALALALKSGVIEKSDLREVLALLRSLCRSASLRPVDPISRFGVVTSSATDLHLESATSNEHLIFLARELHRIVRCA